MHFHYTVCQCNHYPLQTEKSCTSSQLSENFFVHVWDLLKIFSLFTRDKSVKEVKKVKQKLQTKIVFLLKISQKKKKKISQKHLNSLLCFTTVYSNLVENCFSKQKGKNAFFSVHNGTHNYNIL